MILFPTWYVMFTIFHIFLYQINTHLVELRSTFSPAASSHYVLSSLREPRSHVTNLLLLFLAIIIFYELKIYSISDADMWWVVRPTERSERASKLAHAPISDSEKVGQS